MSCRLNSVPRHKHGMEANLPSRVKTHAKTAGTNVFQPIRHPITGETFTCLSSDSQAYIMEWSLEPNGYVPLEHLHLNQSEKFQILEGEIVLRVDGRETILRKGDTQIVPKNTRHLAFNRGTTVARCLIEYRPGLDYLQVMQCYLGLIQDKDYDPKGAINVPKMGYLLNHMNARAMMRPSNIPAPAFAMGRVVFLLIGTLKGWRKDFARYTGA